MSENKTKVLFVTLFELTETYYQIATQFADRLDSYFVVSTTDTHQRLLQLGVESARILDVSATRREVREMGPVPDALATRIDEWERDGLTFPSIVLMSRFHHHEDDAALLHYMGVCASRIEEFLLANAVEWVIAEPTNVIELLAYVVCRHLNLKFGQICFTRLPSNRLVLFSDIEEASYHPLAPAEQWVSADSLQTQAQQWLKKYRSSPARPAYFAAQAEERSFVSLLRSAVRNVKLLVNGSTGRTEINYYRFSDLVSLHIRPYLRGIKCLLISEMPLVRGSSHRKPYVIYFLHVYPERSVDVVAPWFNNQLEVIKQIRRATPASCDVLVKDHPSATGSQTLSFYRELAQIPAVYLLGNQYDSRELVRNAILTCTISGTVALEAALLGCRSLIFSRVFFSKLPNVYQCLSYPDLVDIIGSATREYRIRDFSADNEPSIMFLTNMWRNSVSTDWNGCPGLLSEATIASFGELLCRAADFANSSTKEATARNLHLTDEA